MAKISKGIVITTSIATNKYLPDILNSVKDIRYPVYVHTNTEENNGWELAGIQSGKDNFEQFIHIMDTCLIKDITLFDKLFDIEGNVFLTNGGYHYMGKFVSDTLPELPKITTKEEAISWELRWLPNPHKYFEPDLPVHTDIFEEKFGEKRMLLENKYIKKWKGTYHI